MPRASGPVKPANWRCEDTNFLTGKDRDANTTIVAFMPQDFFLEDQVSLKYLNKRD